MAELSEQRAESRWKSKYLDVLDAREEMERAAAVRVKELGTLIARLSRTLPGTESAGVQARLESLTEALKRKPLDRRLSRDVGDVHTRVLDVMELHERDRCDVIRALRETASNLEQFCNNRQLKLGLKDFLASLDRQNPPSVGELLVGLGALQMQTLEQSSIAQLDASPVLAQPVQDPQTSPSSLGVARECVPDSSPSLARKSLEQASDTGETRTSSNMAAAEHFAIDWVAVSQVLADLLTRLSIPCELNSQFAQVKGDIARGLNEDSVLGVLEQLRDLFDASLADMDREFRGFLDSVDQRLDTLLASLGQAHEQEQAALSREQGLADSFKSHLNTMRNDAKTATDLSVLKSSIDGHLDSLVRSMQDMTDGGRSASEERDARLMAMTNRLQELESESRQARSQLETQRQLALTDALTGLANRTALDQRIREEVSLAIQRSTPLAIAIADIDHFKNVNDTYGHAAGDRALALFARIIGTRVRTTDFCARFGGEEFVILFPATDVRMAVNVVEQVREFVESCGFCYKGEPVPLTASFGVTGFRSGDDVASMLERADKAMYEAKSSGRNRVVSTHG